MGLNREKGGYSASVEGYLVIGGERIRLAKTNGVSFVLAESCELPPGTTGQLVVIVDGAQESKLIELPGGSLAGQSAVEYRVLAPF